MAKWFSLTVLLAGSIWIHWFAHSAKAVGCQVEVQKGLLLVYALDFLGSWEASFSSTTIRFLLFNGVLFFHFQRLSMSKLISMALCWPCQRS